MNDKSIQNFFFFHLSSSLTLNQFLDFKGDLHPLKHQWWTSVINAPNVPVIKEWGLSWKGSNDPPMTLKEMNTLNPLCDRLAVQVPHSVNIQFSMSKQSAVLMCNPHTATWHVTQTCILSRAQSNLMYSDYISECLTWTQRTWWWYMNSFRTRRATHIWRK